MRAVLPQMTTTVHAAGPTYSNWVYIGKATKVNVEYILSTGLTSVLTMQGTSAYRTTDGRGKVLADSELNITDLTALPDSTAGTYNDNYTDVGPLHIRFKAVGSAGDADDTIDITVTTKDP